MQRTSSWRDDPHQPGQGLDVLPRDLDQDQPLEPGLAQRVDMGVHRLDQRRLAHAARAPEQRVVGAVAARELQRVGEEDVADVVDALEQREAAPAQPSAPAPARRPRRPNDRRRPRRCCVRRRLRVGRHGRKAPRDRGQRRCDFRQRIFVVRQRLPPANSATGSRHRIGFAIAGAVHYIPRDFEPVGSPHSRSRVLYAIIAGKMTSRAPSPEQGADLMPTLSCRTPSDEACHPVAGLPREPRSTDRPAFAQAAPAHRPQVAAHSTSSPR